MYNSPAILRRLLLKTLELGKCQRNKRNSPVWFLFTCPPPSNTVNGPVLGNYHSLLSGIEHHRLVGLKPVVRIDRNNFSGGKVAR